ncbi:alpha/beta hydrolase [Bordetella avium]|uniref:Ferric-enterobactin hydrolase n=1 Tax=Bordetella avium (strain 197N) TaxID=360910 RepID=Q2L0P4_BORA1|nr:alpha/beta hydrolase-fold protein [Bordetella avium]AZY52561.1 alpha/beta hydrolase [Bordetella avium]RIQ48613.1 alpha/beta hydrolase [Bordetella avium]RIQ71368.1 alpha/beta hydrolase [Bordetella avium]CAJ49462.1 putative ferric-enterobactin hydrolase [Bordetella avium 197N]
MRRALAVLLLLAAGGVSAQPQPQDFDPALERARLGLLGLVQQEIMPREGGLTAARIYLWAPLGPAPAKGWPVVYMLDGTAAFQALAKADAFKPEAVVVGIAYDSPGRVDGTARAWDYTPRLPDAGAQGTPDPRAQGRRNGGAAQWLAFIEDQVKPWVAGQVPVDPERQTLYGHSYGGLFVLETLLTRPESFQHYVAASPSLWWNAPYMQERLAAWQPSVPLSLRLMIGGQERMAGQATTGDTASIARLLAAKPGLQVSLREFPELGHGPMLPASAVATLTEGRP